MPSTPFLTLVDPRAQHRAHVRQRLLSTALGMLVAAASAIPFLLALWR